MKKRIFMILLTAILLAVSAFPATAEAQHIPVTGTCWLMGMGGWDFPNDPQYRYWDSPNGPVSHWRDQLWLIYCDYSDDRLDGYSVSFDNWNVSWQDGRFFSRNWASGYSTDADMNKLDLWEFSSSGYMDFEWNHVIHVLSKGVGIYQGLLAQTTWSTTPVWGVYHVEGTLLVPGN